MKKKIVLVVVVGFVLVSFLASNFYSRYFDYSSRPAHYKVYINQEPSSLHMGAKQRMDVTVHKELDRMAHVTWLSLIVHPESLVATAGPPPDKRYTDLENLNPSVPMDFVKESNAIALGDMDTMKKAMLISKWVKAHVTGETGNIDALVGLRYIDFSDAQRLITFSPKSAEYATVFAGLMRAQNVPTRLIGGHIFANNQFLTQVWNEVWIEDRGWIAVDVINDQIGSDNRYISFYEGACIEEFAEKLSQVKFGVEREDW